MEILFNYLTENEIFIYLLMFTIILGFEVISKVPSILHTPLMSVTNAISSVIIVGAIIASLAGNSETYVAKNVQMTSMPQMVSIFNGLGGLSAVFLSFIELYKVSALGESTSIIYQITLILSLFIGSVAFTGSMLAFAKLDGYKW